MFWKRRVFSPAFGLKPCRSVATRHLLVDTRFRGRISPPTTSGSTSLRSRPSRSFQGGLNRPLATSSNSSSEAATESRRRHYRASPQHSVCFPAKLPWRSLMSAFDHCGHWLVCYAFRGWTGATAVRRSHEGGSSLNFGAGGSGDSGSPTSAIGGGVDCGAGLHPGNEGKGLESL